MNSDKIEVSVQADLAKSAVGLINELTDHAKLNARRELQLSQRLKNLNKDDNAKKK